jgi:hypothetical protein
MLSSRVLGESVWGGDWRGTCEENGRQLHLLPEHTAGSTSGVAQRVKHVCPPTKMRRYRVLVLLRPPTAENEGAGPSVVSLVLRFCVMLLLARIKHALPYNYENAQVLET